MPFFFPKILLTFIQSMINGRILIIQMLNWMLFLWYTLGYISLLAHEIVPQTLYNYLPRLAGILVVLSSNTMHPMHLPPHVLLRALPDHQHPHIHVRPWAALLLWRAGAQVQGVIKDLSDIEYLSFWSTQDIRSFKWYYCTIIKTI